MPHDLAIEGGFADPVIAGQRAFKAVMDALSRPGTLQRLPNEARPPAPLPQGLAEIALTLCDHDSPVKEIVRAAFASLIAVADSDAERALKLQDFAISERGPE